MHIDTIKLQLGYSQYLLTRSLDGLDQADSLRSPEAGGNCINWVLGHLLSTRDAFLKRLGQEAVLGAEAGERYRQGASAIAADEAVTDIESLRSVLDASHQAMVAGLDAMDPARLADPEPNSPLNNPDETLGSLLAALVFHEIYHTGQIGILRRVIGKGPALG